MVPFITQAGGSVVQYMCADGNVYEGVGIPPDIDVPMDRSDWENFFGVNGGAQIDKRLEAAIRHIDPDFEL
jgi:C-terminal processing protease CtpA/Prc